MPLPQLIDFGIVGWPFDTVIPRMVVGMAVVIVFAIRLIVLVVVGDEVVEVETVMRRDEIDAGPRLASALVEVETRLGELGFRNGGCLLSYLTRIRRLSVDHSSKDR